MKNIKYFIKTMLNKVAFFRHYFNIKETKIPISFNQYFKYKISIREKYYWPIHKNSIVTGNVKIGKNSSVGATPGCYIQGIGNISIGNYTLLAPNVGIISANHDIYDYRIHKKSEVIIGDYCWIGMNSIVLPGVKLGNHVIVGANSVVTKSFEEGYCVLAGNPARVIKTLDKEKCKDYRDEYEYYGYIPVHKFNVMDKSIL